MPYLVTESEKQQSYKALSFWLDKIAGQQYFLYIREMGLLKQYRRNLAPFLLKPLLDYALLQSVNTVLFWTHVQTPIFKWAIGVNWNPIYFYTEQLMQSLTVKSASPIVKNIRAYRCSLKVSRS